MSNSKADHDEPFIPAFRIPEASHLLPREFSLSAADSLIDSDNLTCPEMAFKSTPSFKHTSPNSFFEKDRTSGEDMCDMTRSLSTNSQSHFDSTVDLDANFPGWEALLILLISGDTRFPDTSSWACHCMNPGLAMP